MGFFSSLVRAINKEYDRRIRRASLVTEYGAHHHGHGHDAATDEDAAHAGDHAEDSEIVNVPRGTPVKHS